MYLQSSCSLEWFIQIAGSSKFFFIIIRGKIVSSFGCPPCFNTNEVFPDFSFSLLFFMLLWIDSFAVSFEAFFLELRNANSFWNNTTRCWLDNRAKKRTNASVPVSVLSTFAENGYSCRTFIFVWLVPYIRNYVHRLCYLPVLTNSKPVSMVGE